MSTNLSAHFQLAQRIAGALAPLAQVEAIALSGSFGSGSGTTDGASDIDLYVYTHAEVAPELRRAAAAGGGVRRADFDLNYWGAGDLWVDAATGIEVDLMFFDAAWMAEQIERTALRHQPALGYSTCFWHTVRQSVILSDRRGWFADLQRRSAIAYPEELRRNIVAYNHPVLRGIITSYAAQIEKAVKRRDLASVNHRVAALLASYFDILFAANRRLHPGEKRQVEYALHNCPAVPIGLESDIAAIVLLNAAELPELPARIDRLLDRLDQVLVQEGLR